MNRKREKTKHQRVNGYEEWEKKRLIGSTGRGEKDGRRWVETEFCESVSKWFGQVILFFGWMCFKVDVRRIENGRKISIRSIICRLFVSQPLTNFLSEAFPQRLLLSWFLFDPVAASSKTSTLTHRLQTTSLIELEIKKSANEHNSQSRLLFPDKKGLRYVNLQA